MEFLNRIELRGVVGRADINSYSDRKVCNFSVVTENTGVDKDGKSIVEPTWFNVSVWNEVDGLEDLSQITKGAWIYVDGRLKIRKYVTQDGEERSSVDVAPRYVEILKKDDRHMQPQRDR